MAPFLVMDPTRIRTLSLQSPNDTLPELTSSVPGSSPNPHRVCKTSHRGFQSMRDSQSWTELASIRRSSGCTFPNFLHIVEIPPSPRPDRGPLSISTPKQSCGQLPPLRPTPSHSNRPPLAALSNTLLHCVSQGRLPSPTRMNLTRALTSARTYLSVGHDLDLTAHLTDNNCITERLTFTYAPLTAGR